MEYRTNKFTAFLTLMRAIIFIAMVGALFTSPAMSASEESPIENKVLAPKDAEEVLPTVPEIEENAPGSTTPKPDTTPKIKTAATSIDDETYPEIQTDLSKLPFSVRRMRELILEAAYSGDIEKLRPLIGFGDDVTMLSLGGIEEDPIAFLKTLSGDEKGRELLAILTEVMEMGYVVMDEGTDQELYVWPYFFAWPLDRLSARQTVELFRLVTWGDYEEMQAFGAYIFYRSGITPRGRWRFFVAGD